MFFYKYLMVSLNTTLKILFEICTDFLFEILSFRILYLTYSVFCHIFYFQQTCSNYFLRGRNFYWTLSHFMFSARNFIYIRDSVLMVMVSWQHNLILTIDGCLLSKFEGDKDVRFRYNFLVFIFNEFQYTIFCKYRKKKTPFLRHLIVRFVVILNYKNWRLSIRIRIYKKFIIFKILKNFRLFRLLKNFYKSF